MHPNMNLEKTNKTQKLFAVVSKGLSCFTCSPKSQHSKLKLKQKMTTYLG